MPGPQRPGRGHGPSSSGSCSAHHPEWLAVAFTCRATAFSKSSEVPLRNCPFPIFGACSWSMTDLNTGRRGHPLPQTNVTVARFPTALLEPLDSVMLEGPFHFHVGLFVLDFSQTEDPCQRDHLFSAAWAPLVWPRQQYRPPHWTPGLEIFPSTPTQRLSSLNYDLYYAPE